MGQYHMVYNKTKKECLNAHKFGSGIKLLEFTSSYRMMSGFCLLLANSNGRGGGDFNIDGKYSPKTGKETFTNKQKQQIRMLNEIAGRWAGDEIVIQGDYANENDKAFIPKDEEKEYTDISEQVNDVLSIKKEYFEEETSVLRPDLIVRG